MKLIKTKKKVNNNVEFLFYKKNTGISNPMWIWTWKTFNNLWKRREYIISQNYISNTYRY